MSKKAGILYDNISDNTGDAAIGLSVVKILRDLGVSFDVLVPGRFNAADYETIVVGGGHILRPGPDPYYDQFRVPGAHILNTPGILGRPRDLGYLDGYRYVTVRSNYDKEKLSYLHKKVEVVPCTTMLLEDLAESPVKVRGPSLGIHLLPGMLGPKEERSFIRWASALPYTVYFLPITHYNRDYLYMQRLSAGIRNSVLLPLLKPLEIFTLMGKIDFLISSSLHGAIFAYAHNTPLILMDYDEKMSSFMEERGLGQYLFRGFGEMRGAFQRLTEDLPDYRVLISRDSRTLFRHVDRLKELLPRSTGDVYSDPYPKDLRAYFPPLELKAVQPGPMEALSMRLGAIRRSLDRKLHYGFRDDIVRRFLPKEKVRSAPVITAGKR